MTFASDAYQGKTANVWVHLVAITSGGTTLRYTDDNEDVEHAGETYRARAALVRLPRDSEVGAGAGRIILDDVDRSVSPTLRGANSPPEVSVIVVRADDPETAALTYSGLQLEDVQTAGATVEAVIGHVDLRTEPFPPHSMSPTLFPALF